MTRRRPPDVDDDDATEIYDDPRAAPPLRVISMKTPAEIAAEASQKTPDLPRPKLRPMAMPRHPTQPSGNLAPPRADARSTGWRVLSPIALGAILAIAVGVGLAIWLLASR